MLYALGKQSDNFYAEMIFKSLGGEASGRPAKSGAAAEAVTRWLERIGASDQGVVIKNGSGLFDANRVTAYSTVELLRWAVARSRHTARSIPFAAVSRWRRRDASSQAFPGSELTKRRGPRLKTGTLDLSTLIALSGFTSFWWDGGRGPIAFSILFNHVGGRQDGAVDTPPTGWSELVARWSLGLWSRRSP